MRERPALHRLPHDVLVHVLSCSDPITLLAASQAATALRNAVDEGHVWRTLLWRHHGQILRILFDGQIPQLPHELTWKQRYFYYISIR